MGQRTERFFERGKEFLEVGNNEQALRLFNQVLNREPGHKGALKHKALLLMASEPPRDAEKLLKRALDQQPEDVELLQITGSFYISIGKFEKAEKHLQKSVNLDNNNALAHYGLGIISVRHYSNHQEAIEHFNAAIEQNAELAEALFSRGCSYMIEGNMNQAKLDFQEAQKLHHSEASEMLDTYFNS